MNKYVHANKLHSPFETTCWTVAARGTIVVVIIVVSLFLLVRTLEELFEGGSHFIVLCTGGHDAVAAPGALEVLFIALQKMMKV